MLDFNPNDVRIPQGHFIDGVLVKEAGATLPVLRPSDNIEYAELTIASAEVVDRAVTNAQRAFQTSTGQAVHRAHAHASCAAGPISSKPMPMNSASSKPWDQRVPSRMQSTSIYPMPPTAFASSPNWPTNMAAMWLPRAPIIWEW
jgi:hypothetical protein